MIAIQILDPWLFLNWTCMAIPPSKFASFAERAALGEPCRSPEVELPRRAPRHPWRCPRLHRHFAHAPGHGRHAQERRRWSGLAASRLPDVRTPREAVVVSAHGPCEPPVCLRAFISLMAKLLPWHSRVNGDPGATPAPAQAGL